MDNSFVFNETTLKRVPHFLVFMIILLLGLPYIGLNSGFNFSAMATKLSVGNELGSQLIESQIRGYFRQTLLQWSGFSLAAVTVLLAFTLYRLNNDKVALIIGLAVLFSGSVEALHTLLIDGLTLNGIEKKNLDALIWICSNAVSGLILMFGLMFLNSNSKKSVSMLSVILMTVFLVLAAITVIYYAVHVIRLPDMWFKDALISRPYELISIAIYLTMIIFIYPKSYKNHPTILMDCIFYMAITQIVISIYMIALANNPYDSAYNIAYFLKVVAYTIPFSCFIINYIFSYSAVLEAQKNLVHQQNELKYLASHDSLTKLFNRREFEALLDKSISNASRQKSPMGLLLIDLDNFKGTNDSFGHIHGDELLKQFANRLVLLLRKGDILSRIGGDEFTVIVSNIKDPSSIRRLAERILNELNNPYVINYKLISLTVSIGISTYPLDGETKEDLLRKADMAMYKSKNSGKNTFQFYTDQLSHLQHRESEVEAHLRNAFHNNGLKLYYQPKYNLMTQEIIGAEVLLRWHSDLLGHVGPDEFIPIAERGGLIHELGLWVLRTALEQIVAWHKEHKKLLTFAINISPLQLSNNQFINEVEKALNEFNYPRDHLEFEITESLLVNESEELTLVLNSISEFGLKLSLDDFGKEFSSLNRLRTLPIDTLKIDKAFVSDIKNVNEKVVIVDIIIKLANELGMSIVAEGIETEDQLNYLIARECPIGQGFFMSKPIPADQFAALAFKKKKKQD